MDYFNNLWSWAFAGKLWRVLGRSLINMNSWHVGNNDFEVSMQGYSGHN